MPAHRPLYTTASVEDKEVVSAWEMPFSSALHLLSRDVLVTRGAWRGMDGSLPGDAKEKTQCGYQTGQLTPWYKPFCGYSRDNYIAVENPLDRVPEYSCALADVYHHQLCCSVLVGYLRSAVLPDPLPFFMDLPARSLVTQTAEEMLSGLQCC